MLNYAWRDYGNRAGVFRLAELFGELKLPVSLLVNADMYAHAPQAVAAFPGAEIVGHGRSNSERQGTLSEDDERALIAETTAAIEKHSGARPRGWLGPWISQSHVTPDLLQEAGYSYLLDWCHDDQPTWMKTRKGRILSVPYPQELNDIPQIVARKREGVDFADMIVDAFDVLHGECAKRPLVMGIALHAYIVGQPHRFKHLKRALENIVRRADDKVWFTTSGAIAARAAVLPGHGALNAGYLPLVEAAAHLPERGSLIGLDLGTKTIGVASSDPDRRLAAGVETVARKTFTIDAKRLLALAAERNAIGFVLGLPINMDGSEGPRAQSTRAFARNFAKLTELPIALWDERLSTAAVERELIGHDVSRKKRAAVIDQHAAMYILQGALDRLARLKV